MTSSTMPQEVEQGHSWRDWLARHLRLHDEDKFEIYVNVATSSSLRDVTYWAELLFSAGIATLGLALGSPAVIIGAMLISPLMGPIMSAGLALAAGDFVLAMRAVLNIVLSSFSAILFSTLLVVLLPFREMTAEIASRTHPNTLDLVVALFSGAVGALAVCKSLKGVATSIPGVAIAVALMPPLCVTGYGVGVLLTVDRETGIGILSGGGLLFVTNLIAITFSSMLVFLLLHIDAPPVRAKIREWRLADPETAPFQRGVDRLIPDKVEQIGSLPARLLLPAVLVAIVFVPLKRSFDALTTEIHQRQQLNRVQHVATSTWEKLFGTTGSGTARSYIDRLDATERDGRLHLAVRAFTSKSISEEEREAYIRTVAMELARRPDVIDLSVVEVPTSAFQVARGKKEAEPAPAPPPEPLGARLRSAGGEAVTQLEKTRLPPGAAMLDAVLTIRSGPPLATVSYLAPAAISEDARALIADRLREQIELPDLELRLSWVPSRTPVPFARRSTSLDGTAAATVDSLVAAIRGLGIHTVIESPGSDPITNKRIKALRDALAARGITAVDVTSVAPVKENPENIDIVIERAGSSKQIP